MKVGALYVQSENGHAIRLVLEGLSDVHRICSSPKDTRAKCQAILNHEIRLTGVVGCIERVHGKMHLEDGVRCEPRD
jgi:hypothetical protein